MNYVLLAVTAAITGYVLMRIGAARSAEESEESLRDGYRRRIAQDPTNIGAYEALGDSLRRARRLNEARDAYLQALDAGGDGLRLTETRYKLQQIDADLRERAQGGHAAPRVREMEFCRLCGGANSPQRRHCEVCGGLLPLPSFWEALRERDVQHSALEGICMFVIVIVLMRTITFLSLEIQGVIIMSTAIVVAWWVLRSIEGRRG